MTVNPSSLHLSVYLYLSRCLAGETALSSGRKQPGDLFWELSQSLSPPVVLIQSDAGATNQQVLLSKATRLEH